LLLGLLREEQRFAANLLRGLNVSLDQAREWVAEQQLKDATNNQPNSEQGSRTEISAIQRLDLVRFFSSRPIHNIAVAILTEDKERLAVLQQAVEATKVGRNVFVHVGFPTGQTDPLLHQIQDWNAEAVLIDIDPQSAERCGGACDASRPEVRRCSPENGDFFWA
jgi:Clp amino terminal domain, pathogenicity island component